MNERENIEGQTSELNTEKADGAESAWSIPAAVLSCLSVVGRTLRRGIESLHKHPLVGGLAILLGLILGLLALFFAVTEWFDGRQDRSEAGGSADQVTRVESNIDETRSEGASYKVPKIIGLSYDVARERLLQEGWAPNKNHHTHEDTPEVQSGNGPIFWDRGYWELQACAGTGLGQCKFEFFDPEKRRLVVITEGEESRDGSYHARVSRVYFENENS